MSNAEMRPRSSRAAWLGVPLVGAAALLFLATGGSSSAPAGRRLSALALFKTAEDAPPTSGDGGDASSSSSSAAADGVVAASSSPSAASYNSSGWRLQKYTLVAKSGTGACWRESRRARDTDRRVRRPRGWVGAAPPPPPSPPPRAAPPRLFHARAKANTRSAPRHAPYPAPNRNATPPSPNVPSLALSSLAVASSPHRRHDDRLLGGHRWTRSSSSSALAV